MSEIDARVEELTRLCRKEGWVRLHKRASTWASAEPDQPLWRWARAWAELHGASALPHADRDRAWAELRQAVDDGARPAFEGVQFPFDMFAETDPERRRAKLDAYQMLLRAQELAAGQQWERGVAEGIELCREAAALVPEHRLAWDMLYRFASSAGDQQALAEAKAAIAQLR